MSARTDAPSPSSRSTAAALSASLATPRKPRVALAIATAAGVGYIPFAPGTWGSFAGALVYSLAIYYFPVGVAPGHGIGFGDRALWTLRVGGPIALLLALAGLWAANRAANFLQRKDPQCVVIDEVSGQFLTYAAALAPLNWKYLLLGLILFRAFDIWKPSPAREAESLRGGLGIMADDWVAGVYAAIGLWIARAAGW
jgi:phosphatidylglycerophosphatase A